MSSPGGTSQRKTVIPRLVSAALSAIASGMLSRKRSDKNRAAAVVMDVDIVTVAAAVAAVSCVRAGRPTTSAVGEKKEREEVGEHDAVSWRVGGRELFFIFIGVFRELKRSRDKKKNNAKKPEEMKMA